jgi:GNAT superfamily N-acetyltransferase
MLHQLSDGTRVWIRPVQPEDKRRFEIGMAQLSQESRRRRFLVAKPTLSSAELRYLTEVDGHQHIALVAVREDDPDRIAGVARCVRTEPDGATAEFAIVVADELQGHGLGSALALALAGAARAAGIRRFAATTLADKVAVQRLMEAFAAHVEQRIHAGGVREIVAELDDGRRLAA